MQHNFHNKKKLRKGVLIQLNSREILFDTMQ